METNSIKKDVFMLGGMDLEMKCIKDTLAMAGAAVIDNNPGWGATWDAYRKEVDECLEKGLLPVGIELGGKIPSGCCVIDHHGAYPARPGSLEQVKETLGLPISDYDRLVEANDCGYIPAMLRECKGMGYTEEVTRKAIHDIRRRDRALSGVTDKDEEACGKADVLVDWNGFIVATMDTSRFAPFIDGNWSPTRLYLTRDNGSGEIQLSGHGAMRYLPVMKRILGANMWSGGGEDGYIGGHLHEAMFRLLAGYVLCDGQQL